MARRKIMPTTTLWYGAYAVDIPFAATQHRYAAAHCEAEPQGFAELLEIQDPPPGHSSHVIHSFVHGRGHAVYEYVSHAAATTAWEWGPPLAVKPDKDDLLSLPGAMRVDIFDGGELPWFYPAVGSENRAA